MTTPNGKIIPDIVTKLLDLIADRATKNFFDESQIAYEAERLKNFPVVLVFYFEGADFAKEDFSKSTNNVLVAKGDAECLRYLSGEIPTLNFEAVFAHDRDAAWALRSAFLRRAGKPRLIADNTV